MYCGSNYLTSSNASPALTDFNDDGILDLLLGSQAGKIYVYINTGTPESYSFDDSCFTLATENGTIDLGWRASIQSVDLDGDGLEDILAGYKEDEVGHVAWLRNLGPASPFRYAPPEDLFGHWGDSLITLDLDIYPSVTDLNGDGSLDLIVGKYCGEVFFYPGSPGSGVSSSLPAPALSAVENPVTGNQLDLILPDIGTGSLVIVNLSGRVVLERDILTQREISVQLNGLPAGIYSAVLQTDEGVVQERFTLLR